MNIPCILIPLITGIIAAILGYLLGKMGSKNGEGSNISSLKADLDACRSNAKNLSTRITTLENEVEKAQVSNSRTEAFSGSSPSIDSSESTSLVDKSTSILPEKGPALSIVSTFNSDEAKAVFSKKITENDLKIIEGIGPKIADLFIAAGIKTWQQLAETSVTKCQEILRDAGDRFTMHNPGTWPRQAKMLADGKWAEFKAWTDTLDGGKE